MTHYTSLVSGARSHRESDFQIPFDLRGPGYVTVTPAGKILVACPGSNAFFDIDLERKRASVFIDGGMTGVKDIGNCEYDLDGSLWVNEVEGARVWQFSPEGKPLQALGAGQPGFQLDDDVPFEEAQFGSIFDLRRGPDGNSYALDHKNLVVRKLDLCRRTVSTVVGSGKAGCTGAEERRSGATLGHTPAERYGGPWSLSLDEAGNIYIGDTQNHVVRMVERATNIISTIAGKLDAILELRNNPAENRSAEPEFSQDLQHGLLGGTPVHPRVERRPCSAVKAVEVERPVPKKWTYV